MTPGNTHAPARQLPSAALSLRASTEMNPNPPEGRPGAFRQPLPDTAALAADWTLLRPSPGSTLERERRVGAYTVRQLRRDEVTAALKLYHESGEPVLTPQIWDWRFFGRNPELTQMPAVFDAGGKLVALNPATLRPVWVIGREVMSMQACRTLIHPEHRGGGRVYAILLRYMWDYASALGLPFGFGGGTSERALKVGARLSTYRTMHDLEIRERRLSLRQALQRRMGATGRAVAGLLDLPRPLMLPLVPRGLDVEPLRAATPELDDLWLRKRDCYRILLRRDARELDWRWFRCPVASEMLAVRRSGRMEGYVVLRHYDDPESSSRITAVLDLFTGQEPDLDRALLAAALRSARRSGSDFLHYAPCPGASAWPITRERHWHAARKAIDHVVIGPSSADPAGAGMLAEYEAGIVGANWYYCQGDSDFWD